ncbi:MAG: hypothetical protein MHMPM18_004788, partial [Marteilia pararefringens]
SNLELQDERSDYLTDVSFIIELPGVSSLCSFFNPSCYYQTHNEESDACQGFFGSPEAPADSNYSHPTHYNMCDSLQ